MFDANSGQESLEIGRHCACATFKTAGKFSVADDHYDELGVEFGEKVVAEEVGGSQERGLADKSGEVGGRGGEGEDDGAWGSAGEGSDVEPEFGWKTGEGKGRKRWITVGHCIDIAICTEYVEIQ